MQTLLVQVGTVMGAIAAVIVAGGVVMKSRLGKAGKWMYRKLFGEPVGEWVRDQVGQVVVDKLQTRNGGTTVPDVVARQDRFDVVLHRVEQKLDDHISSVSAWQTELVGRIGADTRTANDEQTRTESS